MGRIRIPMVYKIQYSAHAEIDAETTGIYYEKVAKGLSLRFFSEHDYTITSLTRNTSAFHFYKKEKNIRRANPDIFPFSVFFHIKVNEPVVFVMAVIHQKGQKHIFVKD